jgi:hypothetical protein
MAISHSSIIHQPLGYTPHFDLGLLSKVLLYKQNKFDEGVDEVQSTLDVLYSMDIANPYIKQYANEKLNSLLTSINSNGSNDFSDRSVVNEILGKKSDITNDNVILNGRANTIRMRKDEAQLAESRKTGKGYGVQNEFFLKRDMDEYVNNKDLNSTYNSQGYIPHYDVHKQISSIIKMAHPEIRQVQVGQDEVAYYDKNSVRLDKDYIMSLAYDNLNAEGKQQLYIDGVYNHRMATNDDLLQIKRNNTQEKIDDISYKINEIKHTIDGVTNTEECNILQNQLTKLTSEREKIGVSDNSGNYTPNTDLIRKEIEINGSDFTKYEIETNKFLRGIGNLFSRNDVKYTWKQSPYAAENRFNRNLEFQKQKFGIQQQWEEKTWAEEQALKIMRFESESQKNSSKSNSDKDESISFESPISAEEAKALNTPEKVDEHLANISKDIVNTKNKVAKDITNQSDGSLNFLDGNGVLTNSGLNKFNQFLKTQDDISSKDPNDPKLSKYYIRNASQIRVLNLEYNRVAKLKKEADNFAKKDIDLSGIEYLKSIGISDNDIINYKKEEEKINKERDMLSSHGSNPIYWSKNNSKLGTLINNGSIDKNKLNTALNIDKQLNEKRKQYYLEHGYNSSTSQVTVGDLNKNSNIKTLLVESARIGGATDNGDKIEVDTLDKMFANFNDNTTMAISIKGGVPIARVFVTGKDSEKNHDLVIPLSLKSSFTQSYIDKLNNPDLSLEKYVKENGSTPQNANECIIHNSSNGIRINYATYTDSWGNWGLKIYNRLTGRFIDTNQTFKTYDAVKASLEHMSMDNDVLKKYEIK